MIKKNSVTSQEFCLASYVYWMTNCGYSFQQQYVRDMGDTLKVWVFVCDPGKKEDRRKRDGGKGGGGRVVGGMKGKFQNGEGNRLK